MNTLVRENRDSELRQNEHFVAPVASTIEGGEGYMLQVEMPGVNKNGLEIKAVHVGGSDAGERSSAAAAGE